MAGISRSRITTLGERYESSAVTRTSYGDRRAVSFALDQMGKEIPEAARLNSDNFIDNTILAEIEKSGFIDQIYNETAKK